MKVLNRIGKMAEAAWNESTERLDLFERSGSTSSAFQKQLSFLEKRYDEALQRTIELRQHRIDAEELAQLRGEQAELAMRAGEEELARLALQEKLHQEAAIQHFSTQYAKGQDEVLAISEELRILRTSRAGGAALSASGYAAHTQDSMQPQGELHGKSARDNIRELEVTGRELGKEALQGLREAGRMSRDTLKEAGGNIKQEVHALRGKLKQEWRQRHFSNETDTHGKK
ncbi:hypothetical protein GK047_28345 [Paenibacillus sp. SYP-B3998]|uniref:PspA/IM30 family protein n=1 Tax=Paenibacillus sp. SYP-B3998 TaxID=2678564 RepID=A0A6G4A7B3_9BACL|nr:hypothetical protein [Paenibacillus sp. SYP-B3998]NEW09834.1 hypothetical protein [Paenibacillus sp. SYP-B3998]